MTLGDKIQIARKNKNLTQEALAELLDVSRQAVQKWESNTSIPETTKIIKLSEILEVSTDYLLKDDIVEYKQVSNQSSKPKKKSKYKWYNIVIFSVLPVFMISLLVTFIINMTITIDAAYKVITVSNSDVSKGMNVSIGLGESFNASDLHRLGTKLAEVNYAEQIATNPNYLQENPNLIESCKSSILSKYTLHYTTYYYNLSVRAQCGDAYYYLPFAVIINIYIIFSLVLCIILFRRNYLGKIQNYKSSIVLSFLSLNLFIAILLLVIYIKNKDEFNNKN